MGKDNEWDPKDFGRRGYYVENLQGKKIEVVLKVDGRVEAQLQLREPGIIAFVSRPSDEGVWIESVGPGGMRYVDHMTPEAVSDQSLADWHIKALKL